MSAPDFAPPAPPRSPTPRAGWRFGIAIFVVFATIAGVVVLALVVSSHRHNSSSPFPSSSLSLAPTSSASVSPSNSPSSSSPIDTAVALKQAIAAAYTNYVQVLDQALASTSNDLSALSHVANDPLLGRGLEAIGRERAAHTLERGSSTLSNIVVTVTPGVTTATVSACQDLTHTDVVDASSGAIVHPATSKYPNPVFLTTMSLVNGKWLASDSSQTGNC